MFEPIEKKTVIIALRATEKERELLINMANGHNLNVSNYLRFLIWQQADDLGLTQKIVKQKIFRSTKATK
jgi:hypothetical protein